MEDKFSDMAMAHAVKFAQEKIFDMTKELVNIGVALEWKDKFILLDKLMKGEMKGGLACIGVRLQIVLENDEHAEQFIKFAEEIEWILEIDIVVLEGVSEQAVIKIANQLNKLDMRKLELNINMPLTENMVNALCNINGKNKKSRFHGFELSLGAHKDTDPRYMQRIKERAQHEAAHGAEVSKAFERKIMGMGEEGTQEKRIIH
jgi:hypothetical protein